MGVFVMAVHATTELAMSPEVIQKKLREAEHKPDSAIVSVPVAAAHEDVSERTIRRRYPLIRTGLRGVGVRLGYLRHRQAQTAT
jgi:hypothetical protein